MNKRNVFVIALVATLLCGVVFLYLGQPVKQEKEAGVASYAIRLATTSSKEDAGSKSPLTATFSVEGKSYTTTLTDTASVLDGMRTLESSSDFIFTGKEYPGMGFFVESINSKKNADGYYWFLYINGKSSEAGASQTKISAGDTIEWRYEKEH